MNSCNVMLSPRGDIVGDYTAAGGTHGFLLRGGTFSTIDVPGGTYTRARGISDRGQIVGEYSTDGFNGHGFVAK